MDSPGDRVEGVHVNLLLDPMSLPGRSALPGPLLNELQREHQALAHEHQAFEQQRAEPAVLRQDRAASLDES